ncbi:hypothetical protein [Natrinema versiforme]|uniref:Uncharacterized protein n=1 Tax=Natrinema versiforme JCM 10478 TaxID=1227496 RepID=L9XV28_9EURY|nr:hypothetical protein [Natrinema versiforme]ELY65679.1 hypothetical protein C489_13955 [Natrinema versiforme JCM 10478]
MGPVNRLYDRSDTWLRGLSQRSYAAFLGAATGLGVLVIGLVTGELLLVRALTMALVMFGLESAFGLWQTTDE